ncbi:MAG: alpha/beta fold hydrolase [Smithella sp.]|jgi:pimeloyl-ACP methyl ester carboxylesterase|nr:alpha/beta fold hydrolase [Smithella sp.]
MPYQKINGIEIYYEQHGQGRPLLLLNGLAFPMDLWFAQIPDLSADFRVIAPDNRGIGRSGKPDEEYSIALMASDAVGLLKALGIEKAHIAGLSMGGFIAQEIALSCPGLVDRLILIATSMGGSRARELGRPFWEKVVPAIAGKPAAEVYRTDLSMMSAPGFAEKHKDILEQAVGLRMKNPQPLRAFMRQYAACEAFDTNSRVQAIAQPVMVIAGKDDPVIPFPLSEDFLKKLPGAKMISYENCGHAVLLEKARELTRDIREFLLDETETGSG